MLVVDERMGRMIEKVDPVGSCVTRNGRRRGPVAALAIACGLLQLVASLQTQSGLSILAWLAHPHSHALLAVIDGSHIDLIYSHDLVRHADADEVEAHLHSDPGDDHVVHMTSDDARVAQRIPLPDVAPTFATISFVSMLRPTASAPSPASLRAVSSFARRSVVLRI